MAPEKFSRRVMLVGSTGLVGSELLKLLIADMSILEVITLTRREITSTHRKVKNIVVDFNFLDKIKDEFYKLDTVFCCVGTTIKVAGSKDKFRQVDYDIPVDLAKIASAAEVSRFIVVSSLGADNPRNNYYLSVKHDMEQAVSAYKFNKLSIIRPSLLMGSRDEFRFGERAMQIFSVFFSFLFKGPFEKYKPISAAVVAKAMTNISTSLNNQEIYESSDLSWLGQSSR